MLRKIKNFRSLRKAHKVWQQASRHLRRKKKELGHCDLAALTENLEGLRQDLIAKRGDAALEKAAFLAEWMQKKMPKTFLERALDFIYAIAFALLVAVVIRQVWFELYVIPTGSMRPTLKESDLLLVSKTPFGLNIPLKTGHFLFDPELVQRGTVFVFTGEGMDIPDSDTTYFFLFPGKKQYVKRLIAKPGDTIYFYGGHLYGIDKEGKEIRQWVEEPWFQNLEHIPFIRFDGKVETAARPVNGLFPTASFYQMNELVAKMEIGLNGLVRGEMLAPSESPLAHYSDLWGFKNFAMTRLLKAGEVEQLYPGALRNLKTAPLYLELIHHPNIHKGQLIRDDQGRLRPGLTTSVSFLPFDEKAIQRLAAHMTTCRFQVEKGRAFRIGARGNDVYSRYFPAMPNVPDGTYEIQDGVVFQIYWAGLCRKVDGAHPLYQNSVELIQLLYNLGIEWMTPYAPAKNNILSPSRYAYFREKDLYLMGKPILKRDDPALLEFTYDELQKQKISTSVNPYLPFIDQGPPLTSEGKIDVEFVRRFGLTVPEKSYLALGDNHAMSADSRQFGFVPEENLRGKVSLLFWPPNQRWGTLPQPSYPWITWPNGIVWAGGLCLVIGYWMYAKRRLRNPKA